MNADVGSWITSGMERIAGITYVLAGFHLEKYITKLTSHMLDSKWDAAYELRETIHNKTKQDFENIVDKLETYIEQESGFPRMEEARAYMLSNWSGAKLRLRKSDGVIGSSTERHVSHILSSRMSSRPMGWSKKGAQNMAQLRAYEQNGGNMLELVRHQKKEYKKVSGLELDVLSLRDILLSEKMDMQNWGNMRPASPIVYPCKESHIWGL